MDAVKFLQERNRMYESGAATPCIGLEDDYNPVNAVKIVEEWSAAHPRKTRQSVFLEQWPSAKIDKNIKVLTICPAELDEKYRSARGCCNVNATIIGVCDACRREFWAQEVE